MHTKSFRLIVLEGFLYVVIAAAPPWAEFLVSDRAIDERSLSAVGVISLIAGATALKAFLSQWKNEKPVPVDVVNPPSQPVPVVPTEDSPVA